MTTVRLYLHHLQSLALWKTSIGNGKIRLGPVSRKPRKLFGPVKPLQNLEPCDHKAVLFTYSRWREVSFIQEVSGVNTSPFLDTDDLKMALRARKLSGAFEKRAPGSDSGLKVNRIITFSSTKVFSAALFCVSGDDSNSKQNAEEKLQIKILPFPGLV